VDTSDREEQSEDGGVEEDEQAYDSERAADVSEVQRKTETPTPGQRYGGETEKERRDSERQYQYGAERRQPVGVIVANA
jgi:hypothetical protein